MNSEYILIKWINQLVHGSNKVGHKVPATFFLNKLKEFCGTTKVIEP